MRWTYRLHRHINAIIILSIFALFFGYAAWVLDNSSEQEDVAAHAHTDATRKKTKEKRDNKSKNRSTEAQKLIKKGAVLALTKFKRLRLKNGREEWVINAKKGRYFEKGDTAILFFATLEVIDENGNKTRISADKANLEFDGGDLKLAKLEGNVVVNRNNSKYLYADKAYYERDNARIYIPDKARIVYPNMEIAGIEMTYELKEEVLTFERDVKTHIKERRGVDGA